MKQLSRKKIQDMIDLNGVNISSRRSSGGSGGAGGGGVSSAWVDEHYVSKDFFARLFTINGTDENDDDVVVEPNDLDTDITNIQAMVGLWTEEYLSALGQGSGGGGGGGALLTEPLASINEAGIGTPSGANKVIAWNGITWTYMPYTTCSGTVTSIRITVPTGFKVSPSTAITTAGTFAITFASGYSLPTTAKQTNWDTAYSKANTLESYFDGSGNAKSALKLTTVSKTAWGRTYWTSGGVPDSISGDMTSVGNISFSTSGKNIGGVAYFDTTNSRLGIGAAPGAYKLDVNGDIRTSGNLYIGGTNRILSGGGDSAKNLLEFDGTQVTLAYGFRASNETRIYGQNISMYHGTTLKVQVTSTGLKIGDATLSWDSTNHALKIDTGFYSESFISALGAGSGGGSGSGITMNDVWSALAATAPSSSSEQINLTHMTQALSNYYTKTQAQGTFLALSGGTLLGTLEIKVKAPSSYGVTENCDSFVTSSNLWFEVGTGKNVYSNSTWNQRSDIRMKDVVETVDCGVESIAKAQIFNYRWKDEKDGNVMLGSSAQDWVKIFPKGVKMLGDTYTMDYAGIALASSVMASREIVRLKKKVAELEKQLKAS